MLFKPEELKALGIEAHPTALVSRFVTFYGVKRIVIGAHSRIDHGAMLMGDIEIGRYVHIAPYVLLYGKAGIEIGDYSGIGALSVLHSESDDHSGMALIGPTIPAKYKRMHAAPIVLERNVVIGVRSTVLPGVTMHDGAGIGAHSLVKADCEANTIYGGCPAQKIKARHMEMWQHAKDNDATSAD